MTAATASTTITASSAWRTLGDTTLDTYKAEFTRKNSPLLPYAEAIYNAVKGDSVLFLAHLGMESEYATTGIAASNPDWHNAVGTKVRGGNNQYQQFASWADGAAEWKARVHDPNYAYAPTTTIAQYIHVYAPSSDGNNEAAYVAFIVDYATRFGVAATTTAPPPATTTTAQPAAIAYGNVPKPSWTQIDTSNKPEHVGWDNLGKRTPLFVVWHRMQGTLRGTDSYFPLASTEALTDFGMGVAAADGAALSGIFHQYNDPYGYRSGWASGPVSAPYGDAKALLAKYGDVNICNINGVSLEISGEYDTPLTDAEKQKIAEWTAYWWDQMRIPYTSAPINPATGCSAVTWHQEWTIGTGKVCPGEVVMDATDDMIARAVAILKKYQTGAATTGPVVVPPASYLTPVDIAFQKQIGTGKPYYEDEGTIWFDDGLTYTVTAASTKQLVFAVAGASEVAAPLAKGATVTGLVKGVSKSDKRPYILTKDRARIYLGDLLPKAS